MREIVALVDRVLQHRQDPAVLEEVRSQAKALCSRFPIFPPTNLTEGRITAGEMSLLR